MAIRENLIADFKKGSIVTRLIMVNVVVFLLVNVFLYLTMVGIYSTQGFKEPFERCLGYFGVSPQWNLILSRPWTLIAFMFTHSGLMHIFFNMLFLYWFGVVMTDTMGSKNILPVYVMGSLSGALCYILVTNFVYRDDLNSTLVGASAGIVAIIVAAAMTAPYYRIFVMLVGPVKIIYIAFVSVVIFLLSLPFNNTGGHLAHLGGAFFGFVYARLLMNGVDLGQYFYRVFTPIENFFLGLMGGKPLKTERPYMRQQKTTTSTSNAANNTKDNIFNNTNKDFSNKQDRIDAILDKIKQSGYASLTQEEKEDLFRASKE